jgi:hypothetical protein
LLPLRTHLPLASRPKRGPGPAGAELDIERAYATLKPASRGGCQPRTPAPVVRVGEDRGENDDDECIIIILPSSRSVVVVTVPDAARPTGDG